MDSLISQLRDGAELSQNDVERAVAQLVRAEVSESGKADFLEALRAKGETAREIAAFARAMLAHAVDPGIDPAGLPGPMLDVCGTGGDRSELFNVSTTSMFILTAGGAVVVKHGNRAITSQCGGADVLEALGVKIDLPPAALRRCVAELELGFLFAPAFHPAFKAIAPVRRAPAARGVPTAFNLLGPLLNPARPAHQLVGIFSREALPKYAEALAALGRTRAWAVHGNELDELTTTGPSDVREVTAAGVRAFELHPETLGIPRAELADLRGGDCARNAALLVAILDGSERGPKRDIVLLNAAAGFVVAGLVPDLATGLARAREAVEDGGARRKLEALRRFEVA